jgi:peptidyl-prolyl cis-trans isomerase C
MRVSVRPFLLVLALGSAVACGDKNDTTAKDAAGAGGKNDIGEVIATVNGMDIGSREFEQAAARKAPASGDSLSADEKKEVLDGLVEEKLLYAEALRKGLDKDPKVQKVMVNTLLRDDVYSSVKNSDFTDEQLQKYYDDHKSEFIVPEKVQIKRILVKVSDTRDDAAAKALAEKLRAEVVKAPDSFKDVAMRDSEDPYKRRGGDIGFVSREGKPGIDQEVVTKAFELQTNAISEVFKTSEGYNIVQVANRREQVERTFQQMKGSVLRKVKNDAMKKLYDDYVAKLKTGANTKVDEAKLGAIEVKSARRPFGGLPMGGDGDEGEGEGAPAGLPAGLGGAAGGLPVPGAGMPPVPAPPKAP